MNKSLAIIVLACLVFSASAFRIPSFDLGLHAAHMGRRLMQGGGWLGGIGTEDIMSENDAAGSIYNAVDNDNFGSTYGAAQNGYYDADAATYPDDDAGEFWLNQ